MGPHYVEQGHWGNADSTHDVEVERAVRERQIPGQAMEYMEIGIGSAPHCDERLTYARQSAWPLSLAPPLPPTLP